MNIRRLQDDGSYRDVTGVDFGADPMPQGFPSPRSIDRCECGAPMGDGFVHYSGCKSVYRPDRSSEMLGTVILTLWSLGIAVIFYCAGRWRWL